MHYNIRSFIDLVSTYQSGSDVIYNVVGDCLCPSNQTGGLCQPGYYCPIGSHEPIPCTEGKYCDSNGLDIPSGDCDAGYYCSSAAIRPDPIDVNTGGLCPQGRYCGMC